MRHLSVPRRALGLALGVVVMSATAVGPHAETCYSTAMPAASLVPATNDTVFDCPIEGAQTIVSLSERGYRIVHLSATTNAQAGDARHQLLAQKELTVLQDGFE